MSGWEFWIDRGGTFTDVVARRPDGGLETHKLLSQSPGQYDDAAVEAIRRSLALAPGAPIPQGAILAVKMGTTVATNALLQRAGEPVLLLITAGFADLLLIGTQARPDLFALNVRRPPPLYAEVAEVIARHGADGAEVTPLNAAAARAALREGHARGLRAVAIALLHAHVNPAHEKALALIAAEEGYTQISCSHLVSGLSKITARGDTAVADAYLSPILRRYVNKVSAALDLQGRGRLLFMQSSGGLTDAAGFQGKDAVLSGPAGGIVGMARTAQAAGYDRLIGFDMGGTSTDVSHFAGSFERTFETEVAGVRMRAPMMDIHTVAAGGGSVCHFDGGRFQVGPESAGADPGPACYRRGGPLTVTDCNLFLGRISPQHFPALFGPTGDQPLDPGPVRHALEEMATLIAAQTGQPRLSPEAVAAGFLRIAVQNMANAITKISTQRGHDVSRAVLQCFGGAGGQHACEVADALGMTRIFLHPLAGVLSAYGMGLAEQRALREAQFDAPLANWPQASARLTTLCAEAAADLRRQGIADPVSQGRAHLRYEGSHQALEVDFAAPDVMRAAFEDLHRRRFGFISPERAIRFEMLAAEAYGGGGQVQGWPLADAPGAPLQTLPQCLDGVWREVPLYARASLSAGQILQGPAVIVEPSGTLVLAPGWQAAPDAGANLILTRSAPPQRPPAAGTAVDPVLLEVFNNLFMSVAEQMGATLANTAWSVNIKERLDFSCAIFDASGDLVANAPHVPVHLGSMSQAVKSVMAEVASAAGPGDVWMLNSPFQGGTHLPDVTVITPVFVGGAPAFWLGSRGHHADIGGRTPGSSPPDSTRIEQEGVVIGVFALVHKGALREAETRALLMGGEYPCRSVDHNIADLKAQIAANETGRRGLEKVIADYGAGVVSAYMSHVQRNAEELVRGVIDNLQGGSFVNEMDSGARIAVSVRVDRAARRACIDFTGTSAQSPGNYNAPAAITRAVVLYVFRSLVGRPIPLNEGCLAPLDIILPEGCLLNPRPPAAVIAGNTEVSQAACNALFGASGVLAAGQGTMNNFVWGNAEFQNYETIGGGTGAGPGFAGCDAVQSHMTNTRMSDPEILEQRFPVRLEALEIRAGSGGAGQWRGGNGMRRRLRFLQEVTVTTLCGARRIPPFGAAGGGPGALGENLVIWPDGHKEALQGNDERILPAGSVFEMLTPGGGGWGEPQGAIVQAPTG